MYIFFPAVIVYNTERVYTLGSILRTHCVSAVNSQSVSCFTAVFGPILELTQETGPFWQPPCQPVLHTAAPEPSVMHTCTNTYDIFQCYHVSVHLASFHESFSFNTNSLIPLSFHKSWLERPSTQAPPAGSLGSLLSSTCPPPILSLVLYITKLAVLGW